MTAAPRPPAFARRVLGLRFRGEALEVVEGDLLEYFHRDLAAGRPVSRARRRYLVLAALSVVRAGRRRAVVDEPTRRALGVSPLAGDLRLSIRRLAASPGFTATAVLTLALAIGVNAALFTALRRVVLEPVPFDGGDRMVLLWRGSPSSSFLLSPSPDDVVRWRQLTDTFEWIEAFRTRSVVMLDGGDPEQVAAQEIGVGLLSRLGVEPMLGRPFAPYDDAVDAEPVLLLGESLWRARFGGDPAVVGQLIRLGEESWRVVGVMAHDFRLPMGTGELWLARRGEPTERGISALALLEEGVSIETAGTALRQMPAADDADADEWVGHVMAPSAMFGQTVPQTLVMLAVAVGLLLLMACVNVAGLLMSRYRRRQREFALRLSLGASRFRLFRLLMVESAVLAGLGGLFGLGTAHLTLEAISALRPDTLGALEGLRLDAGVLWFALGTTAVAVLLFGAVPALRAARGHMTGELASGGRAVSATGLTGRGLLGGAQIAVALVLLVGTMLMSRSLVKLSAVDPGFAPDGLVSMQLSLDGSRYDDADVRAQFVADLTGALGDLPAVSRVAQGSGLPPTLGIIFGTPELEGRPAPESEAEVFGGGWAGPGYFSTLGIEVVEGREFTDSDALPGVSSAIVSEGMAGRLAAGIGGSVLGSRVRMSDDGDFHTVVGIVADVQANGSGAGADEQFYLPPPARTPRTMAFAVRTPDDSRPLIAALKARVWALDAELPVASIAPVSDVVWRQAAAQRFGMTLLSAFAAAGLLLAAVGVFGTLALVVAERRREVAVRLSLGATPRQVVSLVTRYVAWITGGGVVVGLTAASLLAPRIQTLLFDVPPRDVGSFALALVVVVLAAIAAAVTPVRRMLAVDPAEALRAE